VKDKGGDLYVVESSFLDHPTLLLVGVNLLNRRRVYAPNSSLFVQVQKVTATTLGNKDSTVKGATVTVGWSDVKEATGAEIARVMKQLRECAQVAELREVATESRMKISALNSESAELKRENGKLKQRVAQLEGSNTHGQRRRQVAEPSDEAPRGEGRRRRRPGRRRGDDF